MSSKDRIWREGDDRWTWDEEESVPRYMWSQIPMKDVVAILNRSHELKAQLERYKTALESIIGQTDDQYYEGVWREVNYTAQEALEEVK